MKKKLIVDGIACDYWSKNKKRLLCYAIELNKEKLHILESKKLGLL